MAKHTILLTPVQKLATDVQLEILQLRNLAEVRSVMFSDHVISTNEHLRWIARLKSDESQLTFGIVDESRQHPLGVVSANAVDETNRRCDWGFYLGPESRGTGLAIAIEIRFLAFVFETLQFEKLNSTVIEGNEAVLKFHKHFGFEQEGLRASELARSNGRAGVYQLGLTRQSWMAHKEQFGNKWSETCEQFAVSIDWKSEDRHLTAIDQIEAARAKNNVNWMNILRIAVEKSPVNARQIIADIRELDGQISALTAKIELEP